MALAEPAGRHSALSRSFQEHPVAESHNSGSTQGHQRTAPPPPPSDPDQETYYDLLGVPFSATNQQITTAYRQAMKRFHPDRVQPAYRAAAEELTKDLNRAFRTLSNPTDRLQYDRSIRAQEVQDQIMRRYAGGFSGAPGTARDLHAQSLKRDPTERERRDLRRSERSAVITLLSVFLVVTLGAIGLILIGGLVSFAWDAVFS